MRRMRWALTTFLVAFMAATGLAQVSIVSPRDGEVVRSRWLVVKVEKPTQEGYVMVWLNNKFVAAVSAPFELRIDLAERNLTTGAHTLKVIGRGKAGELEGEAQVQFRVDLTGTGTDRVRLLFKPRTGELSLYTFHATSETRADVPAKAIRRKVPSLSTKLTLRWFQMVRDVTADQQYRTMRVVEEGVLEREAPIGVGAGAPAMAGPVGAPMGGPVGMGPMLGEEMGAFGPMGIGAPPMLGGPGMMAGMPSAAGALTRLHLRPTDNQRIGLFTLLSDGTVITGEELPSVVRFTSGNIDISLPDRELKIGDRWIGFLTLPRNLENLTIVGAAAGVAGAPMGGMVGGEEMGTTSAPPMMGPMRPGSPMGMMGRRPGMPPSMPGVSPSALGALGGIPAQSQEAEALLADAPVVTAPATHRLDGFEFWNDRLCARIVSEFKVTVELDVGAAGGTGAAPMPGGPMGAPMMGGPLGAPIMPGAPSGMPSGPTGLPSGRKLSGKAEGTRTLLFDVEGGRVVYVKLTLKATFDTDYATVLPLIPQQTTVAGTTGAPGAPMMPGGPMAPTAPGFMRPGGPMGGAPTGAPMMAGAPAMAGAPMMPGAMGPGGLFGGEEMGAMAGTPYGAYGPTPPMMPGMPSAPGVPGAPVAQPTFKNYPAKLLYSLTLENTLVHAGRLDQQLKALTEAR